MRTLTLAVLLYTTSLLAAPDCSMEHLEALMQKLGGYSNEHTQHSKAIKLATDKYTKGYDARRARLAKLDEEQTALKSKLPGSPKAAQLEKIQRDLASLKERGEKVTADELAARQPVQAEVEKLHKLGERIAAFREKEVVPLKECRTNEKLVRLLDDTSQKMADSIRQTPSP